jgi:hypothetical protein
VVAHVACVLGGFSQHAKKKVQTILHVASVRMHAKKSSVNGQMWERCRGMGPSRAKK